MILTFSGKEIDLNNFQPSDFCIEDVAHSLSRTCRYNGHCSKFYSVATHSSNTYRIAKLIGANEPTCLYALMHDAPEAYIGDMPGPLKKTMKEFSTLDKHIDKQIIKAIGKELYFENWHEFIDFDLVNKIDKSLLLPEMAEFFPKKVIEFNLGPILGIPRTCIVLAAGPMPDESEAFKGFYKSAISETKVFLKDKTEQLEEIPF